MLEETRGYLSWSICLTLFNWIYNNYFFCFKRCECFGHASTFFYIEGSGNQIGRCVCNCQPSTNTEGENVSYLISCWLSQSLTLIRLKWNHCSFKKNYAQFHSLLKYRKVIIGILRCHAVDFNENVKKLIGLIFRVHFFAVTARLQCSIA